MLWTSNGFGTSLQLSTLALNLLVGALYQTTLDDDRSHAGYVVAAVDQLQTFRRLVNGEEVDVRCRLAVLPTDVVNAADRGSVSE